MDIESTDHQRSKQIIIRYTQDESEFLNAGKAFLVKLVFGISFVRGTETDMEFSEKANGDLPLRDISLYFHLFHR